MLEQLGKKVIKNYKKVLWGTLIITLILGYFMTQLKLNMKMMDMLPKDQQLVKTYKEALDNFKGIDSTIVGIEGKEEDIKKYLNDIPEKIKKIEGTSKVIYKSERKFLEENSLLLIKEKDLKNIGNMFSANNLAEFIGGINDNFETTYTNSGDSDKLKEDNKEIVRFLNTIEKTLKNIDNSKKGEELAHEYVSGEKYFISTDRKMGMFFIKSGISIDEIEKMVDYINVVEKLLKEEAKKYNVSLAITGTSVIARDEMVVSTRDMLLSTTLSIILIALIFWLAFRIIRYSILSLIPLLLGIIWSMGLTYFFVGSLNMMTSMMGAILIGLGIDYALHIISLFKEERVLGKTVEEAVLNIYKKTARGVIAGSVTTAVGFFVFAFSNFPGFKEFGIVLGTGIICALIASIVVLPALLMIFGNKKFQKLKKETTKFQNFEKFILDRKKIVLIITILLIGISFLKITNVEFEKDMMKIEAKGLESIALNKKIIKKFDFTSDNSIVISENLEAVRKIKKEADKLNTVGEVDSITAYLPSEEDQQKSMVIIKEIKNRINSNYINEIKKDELIEELYRLEDNIIELSDIAFIGGEKKMQEKCDEINEMELVDSIINKLGTNEKEIKEFQSIFIGEFNRIIKNTNENEVLNQKSLPENVRENYIGENGKYLTTIYPKEDVWDADFQKIHLAELETLEGDISGTALVFLEVMKVAGSEGKRMLIWTVILIFIVLLIDLKNLKYALLALVPMLLSVGVTFGIMGWFGIKLTVVNIIAIPLIIGIGVDDGVHIIHRYRIEKDMLVTLKSTGKAILLTTLTTISAFGTLMLAKYRGFVGFGLLLVLGVGLAYLLTVLLLANMVELFGGEKK